MTEYGLSPLDHFLEILIFLLMLLTGSLYPPTAMSMAALFSISQRRNNPCPWNSRFLELIDKSVKNDFCIIILINLFSKVKFKLSKNIFLGLGEYFFLLPYYLLTYSPQLKLWRF
jgi:hypothetical protein